MYKVHLNEVIKLREKTGFGIMDCKKSLIVMGGNFEKAIEFLRKRNKNITDMTSFHKKTQGFLFSKKKSNNKKVIIIGITCETDFVSKNHLFIKLANNIAELAINCNNINEILSSFIKKRNIKDILYEYIIIMGENLILNFFEKLESEFVSQYIHHDKKIAALVGFSSFVNEINTIGKELAMQVVAMNPITLNEKNIPYHLLKQEKEIVKEQECKFSKSKNFNTINLFLKKIIQGKLNKFICENTFSHQKFIKNQKITIQNCIKIYNINPIIGYKRISLS